MRRPSDYTPVATRSSLPREGELEEHMKMLLDYFFDMHNVIKDNMNQLGQAAINGEEKKERVKVKGFSAYKDNTMPIEAKKEEEEGVGSSSCFRILNSQPQYCWL